MKTIKSERNKIHGIIQIIISVLWILNECNFLYMYYVKGGLYIYMKPDVIIFLNILIAILGLIAGYKTIQGQLNIKIGYLIIGLGWLTTFIVEILL